MGKLTLFICLVFLVGSVISATTGSRSSSPSTGGSAATCGRHGDPCSTRGGCCSGMRCHAYANKCQVIITEEMLQNGRRNLKHVPRPKNY